MKRYAAQLWLFSSFLFFLVLQVVLLVVCQVLNAIGPDKLKDLSVQLLTIYSVPLSVIIAGVFAKKHDHAKLDAIFYTAFVLAILWNILLAWRTVALTLAALGIGEDNWKPFSEYLESVSKASTFLISGMLSYYFAKAPEGG